MDDTDKTRDPEGPRETILIIEDDEDVRVTHAEVLEDGGYSVLQARDGMEGWEVFQQHHASIDLVVLDLKMPRMSGQELLSRIRGVDPGAKVIVSTGLSGEGLTDLQPDAIVRKPYRLTHLLSMIRQMLDGGQAADS